jgi:hypothetical protein
MTWMQRMPEWIRKWITPMFLVSCLGTGVSICYTAWKWHGEIELRGEQEHRETLAAIARAHGNSIDSIIRAEVPPIVDSSLRSINHKTDSGLVLISRVQYGQDIILRMLTREQGISFNYGSSHTPMPLPSHTISTKEP